MRVACKQGGLQRRPPDLQRVRAMLANRVGTRVRRFGLQIGGLVVLTPRFASQSVQNSNPPICIALAPSLQTGGAAAQTPRFAMVARSARKRGG